MNKVKKIINNVDDLVPQTLEGLVLASHGRLRTIPGASGLIRTDLEDDKVALLIGGGSGHEPMYTSFVGKGWADVSVAGHISAAPAPELPAGRHTLQIMLGDASHVPFDPPVQSAVITVNVKSADAGSTAAAAPAPTSAPPTPTGKRSRTSVQRTDPHAAMVFKAPALAH